MDPLAVLRDGWRITWKTRQLWILTTALCLAMTPVVLISGGLGGAASAVILPDSRSFAWLEPLRHMPLWGWLAFFFAALAVLVATTVVTWGLQAAAIRVAADASEGRPVTVKGSLHLGRQRWRSIFKLSLTFGALLGTLALLPPLLILITARDSSGGFSLLQMAQSALSPVSSVLGIVLMLVMMAVAIEDLRPAMAFRRAWTVFRSGWWGFLLVVLANLGLGLLFALFTMPVFLAIILMLAGGALGWDFAPIAALLICSCTAPLGLAAFVFVLVFSTVLYTLVYRAASRMADATQQEPAA